MSGSSPSGRVPVSARPDDTSGSPRPPGNLPTLALSDSMPASSSSTTMPALRYVSNTASVRGPSSEHYSAIAPSAARPGFVFSNDRSSSVSHAAVGYVPAQAQRAPVATGASRMAAPNVPVVQDMELALGHAFLPRGLTDESDDESRTRLYAPSPSINGYNGLKDQNDVWSAAQRFRNVQRFREIYGESNQEIPSIEQRLLGNASQGGVPYFDQSVSSGSRHLSPNPPSTSSDQFYGYNPNAPLTGSNPRSASSNLPSASPNPSVSPYHLSGASNPPSLYSNPSPYPNHPPSGLGNVIGSHSGSFQNQPFRQQVDQARRVLQQRVSPPSVLSQRRSVTSHQGIFPIPAVDYGSRTLPAQASSLSPAPGSDRHDVSSGHHLAGSSLQTGSSSAPRPQVIKQLREPINRWFRVTEIPRETPILAAVSLFKGLATVDGPFLNAMSTQGQFYVGFGDSFEAQSTMDRVQAKFPAWNIEPVTRDTFQMSTQFVAGPPRQFEDIVQVFVYTGPNANLAPSEVAERVKPSMELVGPVYQIEERVFDDAPGARLRVHELRVRYYDARHAVNAAKCLNGLRDEHMVLEVLPWAIGADSKVRHWTWSKVAKRRPVGAEACRSPGPEDGPDPRSPGEENKAIKDGNDAVRDLDPRTTIMIKSLAQGWRWRDLKKALDETSLGGYNYLYLRMNFETNANIGYAFVNFVSPEELLKFIRGRRGKAWPGYKGKKEESEPDFCYAKDQGIEMITEKFRNSPVMLEEENFRPKLFHVEGPLRGQQLLFPAVNNFYALNRGVERSKKTTLFSQSDSSDQQTGKHRKDRRNSNSDRIITPSNPKLRKKTETPASKGQRPQAQRFSTQKSSGQKYSVQKSSAQKSSAQKSSAQKSSFQKSSFQKSSAQKSSAQKSSAQKSSAQKPPAQKAPVQNNPAQVPQGQIPQGQIPQGQIPQGQNLQGQNLHQNPQEQESQEYQCESPPDGGFAFSPHGTRRYTASLEDLIRRT